MPEVNAPTIYDDFGFWETTDGRRLRVERLAPHEVEISIHDRGDSFCGIDLSVDEARDLAAALLALCNLEPGGSENG